MSSRRKGKPARRVDTICSELTEFGTQVDASQDENHIDGSPGNSQPNGTSSTNEDRRPVEGVYIVQPESVSDSEGPHDKTETGNTAGLNSNKKESSCSNDTPTSLSNQPSAGLDLSVKRPKYGSEYANEEQLKNNALLIETYPSAEQLALLENFSEEQLRMYQRLPGLLASGKGIMDAMSEIGMNAQQFLALHWMSQLNNPDLKKEPVVNDYQDNNLQLTREDFLQRQSQMAALSQQSQSPNVSNVNDNKEFVSPYNDRDLSVDDGNDRFKNFMMRSYNLMSQTSPSSLSPSTSRSLDRRSVSHNDSMTLGAVSSGAGSIKQGTLDPATFDQEVFDQYISKFTSTNRCGSLTCQYYTRDHYHCVVDDCGYQRFTNKADVIRHYNMHKKRDNSLAHGFLRFSPADDCSAKYPNCTHKGKSTHYHCMQPDCNKVYTSTSDVMTHENFHKKYMQFVCSGFKRFRATEQCDLESCVFRNQKTTHFHCTRKDCNFTFKNKCDIEKHKTYHQRDDHFVKRGFKKFYKNESCGYFARNTECVWNMTSNHLHCLRPGCNFTFTSSSQMESHIRKHDRNEYSNETPQGNSPEVNTSSANVPLFNPMDSQNARNLLSTLQSVSRNQRSDFLMDFSQTKPSTSMHQSTSNNYDTTMQVDDDPVSNHPPISTSVSSSKRASPSIGDANSESGRRSADVSANTSNIKQENEELSSLTATMLDYKAELDKVTKFFIRCSALKCIFSGCEFFTKEHFHCMVDGCGAAFPSDISMISHARFHLNLEQMGVSQPLQRSTSTPLSTPLQQPLQDSVLGIAVSSSRNTSLPQLTRSPEASLDGQQEADISQFHQADFMPVTSVALQSHNQSPISLLAPSLLKAMFQTPITCQSMLGGANLRNLNLLTSAASMTSTPRPSLSLSMGSKHNPRPTTGVGYIHYSPSMPCMGVACKYARQNHWHCTIGRCRYMCKSLGKAQNHRDSHDDLEGYTREAKDSFKSYTLKKPCPKPNCEFRLRGHYHCLKSGCSFVTIGTSKLPWHVKKHEKIAKREASGFKYHTKKDPCRYKDCKHNGQNSHYHCIRPNCSFAFQYMHQMSTHVRKHIRKLLGRNSLPRAEVKDMDMSEDLSMNMDSGDDNLPLVIDEIDDEPESGIMNEQDMQEPHPSEDVQHMVKPENFEHDYEGMDHNEINSNHDGKLLNYNSIFALSQRASGSANQIRLKYDPITENGVLADTCEDRSPPIANIVFQPQNFNEPAEALPAVKPSSGIGQFSKFRLEETTLDGFQKFEISQDCGDASCSLRQKVAHYHCLKENCNYHFTGRSHMFKHYQHHERVAGLVRDDFKRYKGSQLCDDESCDFRGKSTHFHCLRCDFRCTDSAKVGTHRRQHMKADTLQQSGFKRVRGKDDCGVIDCKYRPRTMSHFHCLQPGCSYAIVGLTGIELHAEKHKRGLLQGRQSKTPGFTSRNLLSLQSLSHLGNGFNNMTASSATISTEYGQNSSIGDAPSSSNDGSENGHSNRSSPSLPPAQDDQNQMMPELRSVQSPIMATSPVSTGSLNRVTEGVGS